MRWRTRFRRACVWPRRTPLKILELRGPRSCDRGPRHWVKPCERGLLPGTHVGFVVLETQPAVHRGAARGAEIADEHQRLQIVGEVVEAVGIATVIGPAFQIGR